MQVNWLALTLMESKTTNIGVPLENHNKKLMSKRRLAVLVELKLRNKIDCDVHKYRSIIVKHRQPIGQNDITNALI